jgi:hypothetical protein
MYIYYISYKQIVDYDERDWRNYSKLILSLNIKDLFNKLFKHIEIYGDRFYISDENLDDYKKLLDNFDYYDTLDKISELEKILTKLLPLSIFDLQYGVWDTDLNKTFIQQGFVSAGDHYEYDNY